MSWPRVLDPIADQVRALRDLPDEGPVYMLNLLRFRPLASYSDDRNNSHGNLTGEEAYTRYMEGLRSVTVAKAEVVLFADAKLSFIGLDGPKQDTYDSYWDKVMIVKYPSKENFLGMMRDPAYKQDLVHRYAGLEDTRLIVMKAREAPAKL